VKKKNEKLPSKAVRARQKLKALAGLKTYHQLDTEFGVLTVEDVPQKIATPDANSMGKRRR
jgi:hypothetical protein